MSTRTIPIQVKNEYIVGDGVPVGAAGSHNDVILRMEFSDMWSGLAKTVQFRDALGEDTIDIILTADKMESWDGNVYLVPIPYGAKAYAGKMTVGIKGVSVDAENAETRATLAVYGSFDVAESYWDEDSQEETDVTPTQAEQLQAQFEQILEQLQQSMPAVEEAIAAATAAEAAAQASAKYAEISVGATVSIVVDDTTLKFTTKNGVGTYTGTYTVPAPLGEDTVLETRGLLMQDDMTIQPTATSVVSNAAGGKTLTIGG